VDFPTRVQEPLDVFGDLFANAPARQHVAAYGTGLLVAERQNVSGINRECAGPTDQACLQRWLRTASWQAQALNARRGEWLPHDPKTRYSRRGVRAIDHTLVAHRGKLIEAVGWFWAQAHERDLSAHDSLLSTSVWTSGAPYPIDWRRVKKQDAGENGTCKEHTQ
jgi:hypothetical protein